jgi:hypothetical protein
MSSRLRERARGVTGGAVRSRGPEIDPWTKPMRGSCEAVSVPYGEVGGSAVRFRPVGEPRSRARRRRVAVGDGHEGVIWRRRKVGFRRADRSVPRPLSVNERGVVQATSDRIAITRPSVARGRVDQEGLHARMWAGGRPGRVAGRCQRAAAATRRHREAAWVAGEAARRERVSLWPSQAVLWRDGASAARSVEF